MIETALSTFDGVRFAIDMAWTLEENTPSDLLCHWEATLNPLLRDSEARMVCQYSLCGLPDSAIVAGLRTHPIVVLDGQWRANPYYEAQQILENEPRLNAANSDRPLDEMLAEIARQSMPSWQSATEAGPWNFDATARQ